MPWIIFQYQFRLSAVRRVCGAVLSGAECSGNATSIRRARLKLVRMDKPFDFEDAFQWIRAAIVRARTMADEVEAVVEAERFGLVEHPCEGAQREWRRSHGHQTIVFRYRFYDPTPPFSPNLPDVHVMSVEVTEDGKVVRKAEERYEDRPW